MDALEVLEEMTAMGGNIYSGGGRCDGSIGHNGCNGTDGSNSNNKIEWIQLM